MTNDDVLEEFRAAGALREGHFVLSSGLHSPVFLQKNLVFAQGDRCERLCRALAEKVRAQVGEVDVCISPAIGGIIGEAGGNIVNLRMHHRQQDFFDVDFDIDVKDARHLTLIIAALRANPSVDTVDRAMG